MNFQLVTVTKIDGRTEREGKKDDDKTNIGTSREPPTSHSSGPCIQHTGCLYDNIMKQRERGSEDKNVIEQGSNSNASRVDNLTAERS